MNKLYEGAELSLEEEISIIGLFRMDILDQQSVIERARGKPVWLGLAKSPNGKLNMKPQNVLINLPLQRGS